MVAIDHAFVSVRMAKIIEIDVYDLQLNVYLYGEN